MLSFTQSGTRDGPTLVFLHAVGVTSWMWQSVVAHLPDFNCVLIDLPGHGDSQDIAWHSFEETARSVARVVDQLGDSDDVHIVGLSLGAYVGLTVLCQQPERFRTAILSGLHAGGMPNKFAMKLMSWVIAPIAMRPFFARKTARMFGGDDAAIEKFVVEAGKTRAAAFRRASIDAVDFEMPESTAQVRTRTMVAAGGREHALILSSLPVIAGRLQDAITVQAPGLGHGWSHECSQLFARTVRAHVTGAALPISLVVTA